MEEGSLVESRGGELHTNNPWESHRQGGGYLPTESSELLQGVSPNPDQSDR